MLSDIDRKEIREIPYAGAGVAPPATVFDLPPNQPFNLSHIRYTMTAGAVILLANFTIRDETGATVGFIGLIPWQPATTTVTNTVMQTPKPQAPAIFAARAIGGVIAADFYVFRDWTIELVQFLPDAGFSISAVITLNR